MQHPLLDHDPYKATHIFEQYFPWQEFRPEFAAEDGMVLRTSLQLVDAAFDDKIDWLPDNSWAVILKGLRLVVKPFYTHAVELRTLWLEGQRLDKTLDFLKNANVERVHWSEETGFSPKAGALGLAYPEKQMVLRWPDGTTRWLIFGANDAPYGQGVFCFDKLMWFDENGNIHPMWLGKLRLK